MKFKFSTFPKVIDAAAAGELPRGSKLVVGADAVELKHKDQVLFRFAGTPAQFARHLLVNVMKTRLKVELDIAPAAVPARK